LVKRSQLHEEYLHVSSTLCAEFGVMAEGLFRRLMVKLDESEGRATHT
jgi:hypothetical protein